MAAIIGFIGCKQNQWFCAVCAREFGTPGFFLRGGAGYLYACTEKCRDEWEHLPESRRREIADAVRSKGWVALAEIKP